MNPPLKLSWSTVPAVSGYHAVEALFRKQPLADAALEGAIRGPAEALFIALAWDTPQPERFFAHLVPLAARFPGNLELARTALTKVLHRDHADALALKYRGLLTDVLNAFLGELPRLQEQFPIAGEALQQSWQAHGTQLLVEIGRETEEGLFVEEADVLLLHPLLAGLGDLGERGQAHVPYNSVRIETVFDRPELPEIVRLAWLLSRLNLDLPRFSEAVNPQRLDLVAGLALIPPALAAAKEAELLPPGEPSLPDAVAWWLPSLKNPAETTDKLRQWWEVYRDTRPPLGTALGALDRLLGSSGS